MNRLFLLVLLTVASICAASYDPYVPPFNTPGGVATSANLEPSGGVKSAFQGATTASGAYVLLTSTPKTWTLTASATDFFIQGLGTSPFWLDFGQVATIGQCMYVHASGTVSRDAAGGFQISMTASPSTYIYRVEGRR